MRLLIADDERLVRYHIRCLVAEADPTIEVMEVDNGRELVELVMDRRVDAALVDIRMPKLDGLQALRELSLKGRAVPWAVLSSHSEFEYAKRALDLGALGYALKPPSAEEIASLVMKLSAAFDRSLNEHAQAFEREWIRIAYDGAVDLPSARPGSLFTAALLVADGEGTESEVRSRLATIARVAADRALRHAEEGLRAAPLLRPEALHLELAACAEATEGGEPNADAMRRFWTELASAAAAERGVQEADEAPAKPVRIAVVVAESAEDPTEARGGLESALSMLELRALLPAGVIDVHTAGKTLTAFGAADLEAAIAIAHALSAMAKRDRTGLREAVAAYAAAERAGIGDRGREVLSHFLGRVLPEAVKDDLCGTALQAACEKTMESGGGEAGGRRGEGDTIAAVEEFVRRRFAERLSLAETARIFGLTPNYLSALFHRRVGMTFVEYATELRLSRAREFLRTGKSVKEAAWAVGYGSERHFARLYRERFGSPPVEEKRANQQQQSEAAADARKS